MKSNGVIRYIDNNGRLVIPKEIRDKYKITSETPVVIGDMGNGIISVSLSKDLTCPKCDRVLTKDSLYCNYCGTKL